MRNLNMEDQNQRSGGVGPNYQQTVFQLVGFDRVNFVGDVTNAIPQNDQCRITSLLFEADGVRAKGRLTVYVTDGNYLTLINRQLQSVRGLVSVHHD